MAALRQEIDKMQFEEPTAVSWKEAQDMPYLQACIKEALRLHPAVGMPLERVVPDGGLAIGGHWFRPGTVVGINAWALHRNREVFGEDAEHWRPERWIEAPPESLKRMDRASLAVSPLIPRFYR